MSPRQVFAVVCLRSARASSFREVLELPRPVLPSRRFARLLINDTRPHVEQSVEQRTEEYWL